MLNCGFTEQDPICVPDSGKYPTKDAPDFGILAYASKKKKLPHTSAYMIVYEYTFLLFIHVAH